ncbi:MAG: hypothetical protein KAS22_11185, partial [Candidatus Heimdallarchaeota archaeon]|nr:hypothetical protein [Candidatus Heimdallarchaeota archaeon]
MTKKLIGQKTLVIIFSIFFLSSSIIINFTTKTNIPGPYQNPNAWTIKLQDDFSGSTLNLSHWSYNYPTDWPNGGHTHNHQAYMNESNVVIKNGLLRLVGENQRHPDAPDPEWGFGKWLTYN